MRKAIFIDRDGVINSDEGHYYIYKPTDFILNDGVGDGLRLLQDAGYLLIVITNQGGVAKGIYSEADVELVHDKMRRQLANFGVQLTAIYYCPHHSDVSTCECRKPSPYNILKAIDTYHVNASKSWMIGDSDRDVEAGIAAGLKARKVKLNGNLLPVCKAIINGTF